MKRLIRFFKECKKCHGTGVEQIRPGVWIPCRNCGTK